jgi:hypothetical protein
MQALTKTEQNLLNKFKDYSRLYTNSRIPLQGRRECDAAKKLVARGLAKEFTNLSGYSRGEYTVSPFTRKAYITKTIYVAAGELIF